MSKTLVFCLQKKLNRNQKHTKNNFTFSHSLPALCNLSMKNKANSSITLNQFLKDLCKLLKKRHIDLKSMTSTHCNKSSTKFKNTSKFLKHFIISYTNRPLALWNSRIKANLISTLNQLSADLDVFLMERQVTPFIWAYVVCQYKKGNLKSGTQI